MPNHNPRLWPTKYGKECFPGKPHSPDVKFPEVSIGGSQHFQYSA